MFQPIIGVSANLAKIASAAGIFFDRPGRPAARYQRCPPAGPFADGGKGLPPHDAAVADHDDHDDHEKHRLFQGSSR